MNSFECAWEQLRPAPKVSIDFGDGRVLERTLVGNIATWFVTPDGVAVDVVPGLVDPKDYAWRVNAAAGLLKDLPDPGAQRLAAVHRHHIEPPPFDLLAAPEMGVFAPTADPNLLASQPLPDKFVAFSKFLIEDPIKSALGEANQRRRMLKGRMAADVDPKDSLLLDTRFAQEYRDPVVSKRFRDTALLPTPSDWTEWLFVEVLDVDVNDPWLGLAPYVLGSETGRE